MTGAEYRSFGALRNAYRGAQLSAMPLYFLKSAPIYQRGRGRGRYRRQSHLVFELLPLTLKKGQDKNAAAHGR
jgi:hypothetical protein